MVKEIDSKKKSFPIDTAILYSNNRNFLIISIQPLVVDALLCAARDWQRLPDTILGELTSNLDSLPPLECCGVYWLCRRTLFSWLLDFHLTWPMATKTEEAKSFWTFCWAQIYLDKINDRKWFKIFHWCAFQFVNKKKNKVNKYLSFQFHKEG